MAVDERPVDRVPLDQLLRKTIEDSEVRAWSDRKVHLRLPRRVGPARIDHDRARRVGAAQPVELVHPQHRLRLRGVDPDMKDRVAVLQIVDTVRLTVATERLLQRLARSCRAEPCVAVEMVRPDPPRATSASVSSPRERAGRSCRSPAPRPPRIEQPPGNGQPQDPLPHPNRSRRQLSLTAHEWTKQAIGGVVRLPAIQALGAETAVIDTINVTPANPDDPALSHTDFKPAPVRSRVDTRTEPTDRPHRL